ncbi:MAG TPA: sulfatase [Thermoanaerobaculia bacterium]|jgi:arylsulfatase A-like enzyme
MLGRLIESARRRSVIPRSRSVASTSTGGLGSAPSPPHRQHERCLGKLAAIIPIALAACQAHPLDRARPHLVLVSLDTLRADHLDLYGYPRRTAPNLRRFAEEAIVFDRAYSQSPKTAPSHMTLLTGLYPAAHAVRNLSDEPAVALSPSISTLAELLAAAGYETGAHTASGHVSRVLGFNRGFQQYFEGGGAKSIFAHAAEIASRLSNDGSPSFVFAHTYQIHDPYVPPDRFQVFNSPSYAGEIVGDRARLRALAGEDWSRQHEVYWDRIRGEDPDDVQRLRDLYDAAILYTDVQVGRLFARLRNAGLYEDALIIVLSDHGEEFREHGEFLHDSLYEEILHVPLIVRFPNGHGDAWGGRRIASPVRLVDVLPTVLDYLDLPIPRHLQGESFLDLIADDSPRRARPIFAHWPLEQGSDPISIRLDSWKLIEDGRGSTPELFDLAIDPGELDNRASERPEGVQRLRELRRRMLAESLALHAQHAAGNRVEISPELENQLRALGYLR